MPLPASPECVDGCPADRPWRIPHEELAREASRWRRRFGIVPARGDSTRIGVLLVDVQNTFCLPDFELFVGGRSGDGALADTRRLAAFLYRNADCITGAVVTLDTHEPAQLFHPVFLVDPRGRHPVPLTEITVQDLEDGRWRFNRDLDIDLPIAAEAVDEYLAEYARQLEAGARYRWTIWPYHALLGSPGHDLVSAVEAALFFHGQLRDTQPRIVMKGSHPLTEHYSALQPEVVPPGAEAWMERRRDRLLSLLEDYDVLVVGGQAKSHCVAWTVRDLLEQGFPADRLCLLEDCTSPVVAGDLDFTDAADAAFEEFRKGGARLVRSTNPGLLSAPPC